MTGDTIKTSSLLESDCPHRRYLGRSVRDGLTRNLDWWRRMFKKGIVDNNFVSAEHILDADIDLFINTISGIMESLQFHYPNSWEVHLEYELGEDYDEENDKRYNVFTRLNPYFLIRFSEVNITNSEGKFHTIKELYYIFRLNTTEGDFIEDHYRVNSYYPSHPLGARGKLTALENYNRYHHSHLSQDSVKGYNHAFQVSEFCTGSNELNDLQSILREGFDPNIFNLYLLTVQSFVAWESIEGSPYRYIKKITEGLDKEVPFELGESTLKDHKNSIADFMGQYTYLEANFQFMVDRFIVKVDDRFTQFVNNRLIATESTNLFGWFLVKRHETHYKGFGQMPIHSQQHLDNMLLKNINGNIHPPYTYIRGEKIVFKIIAHEGVPLDPNDFTVHPSLLNYIKKQFEDELYKKQVQRSAIEASITGDYAQKCIA